MPMSEQCPKCGRKMHHRVACKPPLSIEAVNRKARKAMEASADRNDRRAQDRGFGLALALCQRTYDSPTTYAEVMSAYGLTMRMAKASGLEEFDLAPLRVIAREVNSRKRRRMVPRG